MKISVFPTDFVINRSINNSPVSLSSDELDPSNSRMLPNINGNFLLKHPVGSIPRDNEIDKPLNYAGYYYLEALKRMRDINRIPY